MSTADSHNVKLIMNQRHLNFLDNSVQRKTARNQSVNAIHSWGLNSSYKKRFAGGVSCFVGEFWTARQRQARRIHELSYRACFKPQLPAYFIERLSRPGDIVYDPFMGRGTTVIEALLRGRGAYGNDINPLSAALTEPRINPPGLHQIKSRLAEIPWKRFKTVKHEELLVFYHPKTLAQIEGLRTWLKKRKTGGRLDKTDRWIQMTAINRLTGHSSGFFSIYTLPPNQAVSLKRQKEINRRTGKKALLRNVPELIAKKSKVLLSQEVPTAPEAKYMLLTEQSHQTPQIPSHSVQLVVTSPPFLDTVDYINDNWLRAWFLGIDLKALPVSQYKNIEDWSAFIKVTLKELARVVRPGGHIAFEVGETRKGSLHLERYVLKQTENLPLKPAALLINEQSFTKTANCWGVSNNKKGTNSNRIVLLKRIYTDPACGVI